MTISRIKVGVLLMFAAVCLNQISMHQDGNDRCSDLLMYGRWQNRGSPVKWQPWGMMTAIWNEQSISTCLRDQNLTFIGDSVAREAFWAVAHKIDGVAAKEMANIPARHEGYAIEIRGIWMQFIWDPYLHLNYSIQVHKDHASLIHATSSLSPMVLSTGLWQARHHQDQYLATFAESFTRIDAKLSNTSISGLLIPPPNLEHSKLNLERAATLTSQRISAMQSWLAAAKAQSQLRVAWALNLMTKTATVSTTVDGLHVSPDVANQQTDMILGHICNHVFRKSNKESSYTCSTSTALNLVALSITILGLGLMLTSAWQKRALCLYDNLAVIFGILEYCFIADRTTIFSKSNKSVSSYFFLLSTTSLLVLCIATKFRIQSISQLYHLSTSGPTHVLSRNHTDEIKGWMQIIILFYHYYGMSSKLWIYKIVRILVATYLFLLGYGHGVYFQKSQKFELQRLVSVLLRINTLSCLLTFVMNTTYDFYYFPCVSTFWFTIISGVCRLQHSQTLSQRLGTTVAAACTVHLFLRYPRGLEAVLKWSSAILGPHIEPKELLFRLKLDHLAPFWGLVLANVQSHQDILALQINKNTASRLHNMWSCRLMAASFILVLYCTLSTSSSDKYQYNGRHPYISVLPIMAYIIVASLAPSSVLSCSPLLITLGRNSLELYILQYHIWLASDTKGLLRIGVLDNRHITSFSIPIDLSWTYAGETILSTVLFFALSNMCADAIDSIVRRFTDCKPSVLLARLGSSIVVLWLCNALSR